MRYLILLIAILFTSCSTNAESLNDVTDSVFEKKVLEVIRQNPEFIEKTMQNYVEEKRKLAEDAKFEATLKTKKDVNYGESPAFGNKNAKYKLVVFTDFQCPYCKRGDTNVTALRGKYQKDIYVVYKNYPLPFHAEAKPAALAALAAHQQNKFLDYGNLLFAKQKDLGENTYIEIAKTLNLDIDKFKADMKSEKIAQLLEKDIKEATRVGVSSTPNFFINGVSVAGAYPIEYFEKVMARLK